MSVSIASTAIVCLLVATVSGTLASQGCPDFDDPNGQAVFLPHESDCNQYYICNHGNPVLMRCGSNLHFNTDVNKCDWPHIAGCADRSQCPALSAQAGGVWSPPSCNERNGRVDEVCTIECEPGYEHKGGEHVECTPEGWVGQFSPLTPKCFVVDDLGDKIVAKIEETLSGRDAQFLFLLDGSASVEQHEYAEEIRFMKALVGAFPLSERRSSGVITFAREVELDIGLYEGNTCSFISAADQLHYSSGDADINGALGLALQEIQTNAEHQLTLVFLVVGGESSVDLSAAADALKETGAILFVVGVSSYQPWQLIPLASLDQDSTHLFLGFDNFDIFKKVAEHLERKYTPDEIICPR